jgi:predicted ATPase
VLTRIEIDGFKSFANFTLDLNPFTVILGQNGSGKSNLFDAMQLLRRLMNSDVRTALSAGRGEVEDVFRVRGGGSRVDSMRLAVEVLVDPEVVDQFGGRAEVAHTRMRYELQIAFRTLAADGVARPYVIDESVTRIRVKQDRWLLNRKIGPDFRKRYLRHGSTAASPLLEIDRSNPQAPAYRLRRSGKYGRPREFPAGAAATTALSSVTTAEFPELYALRREIESWRLLQLDPMALRRSSGSLQGDLELESTGANLAKVLLRIEQQEADPRLLADIAADLSMLIRGLIGVHVEHRESTDEWEVVLDTRDLGQVRARVASDGTLRLLAVLVALYDPESGGLICLEEPENGVQPERLRDLLRVLRRMVTTLSDQDVDLPLSQVLVTSHSPVMLFSVPVDEIVVLDWVSRTGESSGASRVTRARRLVGSDQHVPIEDAGDVVSKAEWRGLSGIDLDDPQALLGA